MKQEKTINYFGWILLAWFAFSALLYLFSGKAFEELSALPAIAKNQGTTIAAYYLLRAATTLSMILAIPLALKGNLIALVFGLPYLAIGFNLNPFHYFLPKKFAIYHEGIYFYPPVLGPLWGVISVALFVAFLLFRRHVVKSRENGRLTSG